MVVEGYFFILSRVAGYFSFVLAEITRQRAFGRLFCVIFAEISGQLVFGGVLHSPFDTKNPPKRVWRVFSILAALYSSG
jgi:hypothetical protein